MIPVSVLTGFLGSGKTTLLAQWLQQSDFSRTAVIINEFGDIGLDHHLIETSEDSVVQLTSGCLCCVMRDDLVETLLELQAKRRAGNIPQFERVVIETSGMADPTGICHALMNLPAITGSYFLEHIVATVDSTKPADAVSAYPESVRQLALADRVVVTKTDLTGFQAADYADKLTGLNQHARVFDSKRVRDCSPELFGKPYFNDPITIAETERSDHSGHAHGRVQTITLIREEPIHAACLALFLEALAEHYGARLLRLKGLVALHESPEIPAVVHGVQHVLYPLRWLDRWPDHDHRSRIVLIGENLSVQWVELLLSTIEAEVIHLEDIA